MLSIQSVLNKLLAAPVCHVPMDVIDYLDTEESLKHDDSQGSSAESSVMSEWINGHLERSEISSQVLVKLPGSQRELRSCITLQLHYKLLF